MGIAEGGTGREEGTAEEGIGRGEGRCSTPGRRPGGSGCMGETNQYAIGTSSKQFADSSGWHRATPRHLTAQHDMIGQYIGSEPGYAKA